MLSCRELLSIQDPSSRFSSTRSEPNFWLRQAQRASFTFQISIVLEIHSHLALAAARSDDLESVDWNKKVPHILATAGLGGFVTVWDVKTKKTTLTLATPGRKPVGAVVWDPENSTKLITVFSG